MKRIQALFIILLNRKSVYICVHLWFLFGEGHLTPARLLRMDLVSGSGDPETA